MRKAISATYAVLFAIPYFFCHVLGSFAENLMDVRCILREWAERDPNLCADCQQKRNIS